MGLMAEGPKIWPNNVVEARPQTAAKTPWPSRGFSSIISAGAAAAAPIKQPAKTSGEGHMADTQAEPKLLLPQLKPFYDFAVPLAWPVIRIACGWNLPCTAGAR